MKDDTLKLKSWFSFSGNGSYPDAEKDQAFFDLNNQKWVENLISAAPQMKNELQALKDRNDRSIVPYFNRTLANKPENWTIFPFLMWGMWFYRNAKKCPYTTSALKNTPGLLSATFSILKPGAIIPPHVGDSNIMYRCHVPLRIPKDESQSFLEVAGEKRNWQEGVMLAFCDAQLHTASNLSTEERWVLILDVIRPEFRHKKSWINAQVYATLLIQFVLQKFYFIKHFPTFIRRSIMIIGALFTWPYLMIRSIMGALIYKLK